MNHATAPLKEIEKALADPETKRREPGCLCTWEEGDSPCPVHRAEDDYLAALEAEAEEFPV